MPNTDNASVAFKGRMMTLTVLEVHDTDIGAIGESVQQQVARSPGFFARMPVLLSVQDTAVDLAALQECLTAADLVVVGVLDADEQTAEAARTAGLGVLSSPASARSSERDGGNRRDDSDGVKRNRPRQPRANDESQGRENARKSPTRLITQPVRSGQQIYARGGDLVVTSSVSEGAEVLADGHVHIYGVLRGRALAGASGDTAARIFCRRFKPDLVAIAGCYKVADAIERDVLGVAVQVHLANDNLLIEVQE